MADELGGAMGGKVCQDGHDHGLIGVDGQEADGPAGGIAGAQGYFVPFADAGCLKENMQLLYLGRNLGISVSCSAIVAKRRFVCTEVDLFFQFFQVVFHLPFCRYVQRYKESSKSVGKILTLQ